MGDADVVRLSELLGRIDGKLDGLIKARDEDRAEISELWKRITDLERFKSKVIGLVVGSSLAGGAAGSAVIKALLS